MRTDAGITVHSHLRMSGRWTVLGAGRRLPRTVAARLRIALRLHDDRTLAGIDLPVLTLVRTGDEHRVVGHLGPDLLDASTATDEGLARAAARVVAAGPQPVVAALLDQRRVAGLGNMWAQELLFLHGVDPWRPASAVDPVPLLADARRRLRHAVDHDPSQNTTGRRSPGTGCTAAPGVPACAAPPRSPSPRPPAPRTAARPGGARAANTDRPMRGRAPPGLRSSVRGGRRSPAPTTGSRVHPDRAWPPRPARVLRSPPPGRRPAARCGPRTGLPRGGAATAPGPPRAAQDRRPATAVRRRRSTDRRGSGAGALAHRASRQRPSADRVGERACPVVDSPRALSGGPCDGAGRRFHWAGNRMIGIGGGADAGG